MAGHPRASAALAMTALLTLVAGVRAIGNVTCHPLEGRWDHPATGRCDVHINVTAGHELVWVECHRWHIESRNWHMVVGRTTGGETFGDEHHIPEKRPVHSESNRTDTLRLAYNTSIQALLLTHHQPEPGVTLFRCHFGMRFGIREVEWLLYAYPVISLEVGERMWEVFITVTTNWNGSVKALDLWGRAISPHRLEQIRYPNGTITQKMNVTIPWHRTLGSLTVSVNNGTTQYRQLFLLSRYGPRYLWSMGTLTLVLWAGFLCYLLSCMWRHRRLP